MNEPLNPSNSLDPIGNPLHDSLLPGAGIPNDPADPLKPQGTGGAMPDPLQLGDPMLDAVEQSIVNPPGFADPVVEHGAMFMDDVAKRLDQVEASIENPPPSSPLPAEQIGGATPTADQQHESVQPGWSEENEAKTPEVEEEDQLGETPDSQKTAPLRPELSREPQVTIKSGDGGHGGHREPSAKSASAGARFTKTRGGRGTRFCPDTSYSVDNEDCQDCDKYRHWPEGTEEEPRECWHDWVAKPKFDRRREEVEEEEQ